MEEICVKVYSWRTNNRSYRKTLRHKDQIDDVDEQNALVKACHKRCALRTLHVLEKNGGIFIKLGQHLVGPVPRRKVFVRINTDRNRAP